MGKQKYICVNNPEEKKEEIFIFPVWVDHDTFYEGVRMLRNHTWGNWHRVDREIISAGFIDKDLKCHGKSESLKVESRGDVDTELLKSQFTLY